MRLGGKQDRYAGNDRFTHAVQALWCWSYMARLAELVVQCGAVLVTLLSGAQYPMLASGVMDRLNQDMAEPTGTLRGVRVTHGNVEARRSGDCGNCKLD